MTLNVKGQSVDWTWSVIKTVLSRLGSGFEGERTEMAWRRVGRVGVAESSGLRGDLGIDGIERTWRQ